jgi:simple sugar transport system substrate-binding protein
MMMLVKRLMTSFIFGALMFGVLSASAAELKIGFIYPSPVGDVGWAHELDNGRKAIEAVFGDRVETIVAENIPEGPDASRIMNQMASKGVKMIMIGSFGYMNDGLKLANKNPDMTFIHASGYKLADNFGNFQTRNYESAYLAGIGAGFLTKSNILGIVAAYPIPEVVGIINAFTLGAQSVNQAVSAKVVWLNSWFDPSKAQESARSLASQQADVLLSLYQDTPSVVSVAEELGVYVVPTSSDMKKYAPNHLLVSQQIDWGPHFVEMVRQTLEGNFKGIAYWGGMQDDAVRMASWTPNLSADQMDVINQETARLKAGTFHPFTGPIVDQAGTAKLSQGEVIEDGALLGINWLVKGVETKLPN